MNLDLAGYGIDVELKEGDLILDAVVLLRVQSADNLIPALVISNTPGLDWMLQIGMIEAARDIMRMPNEED